MMQLKNRWVLLLILMLVAALVLVACEEEEDEPAADNDTATTEVAEATEAAEMEATEAAEMEATEAAEMEATEEVAMAATEEAEAGGQTIADIAKADENFSILVQALETAELVETFSGEGPFTVFAPADSAFDELPAGMLDAVMSSPPSLDAVLKYHVVPEKLTAEDLAGMDGEMLTTLLGAPLMVSVDGDTIMLNGTITVVTADIEASNGVIHVIDAVLVPERPGGGESEPATTEEPVAAATEEVAMAATEEAEMEATEEPAAAATEEPAAEATAEATEAPAEEPAAEPTVAATEEPDTSLVGVAAAAGDFGILLQAVEASGNLPAVQGEGPFTVFAPTDEAFAAALETLGYPTVTRLMFEKELLSTIVLNHVVEGKLTAADLAGMDGEELTTLGGGTLAITVDGDTVSVNGVPVETADIEADNGIIHVIGAVLVPAE